MTVTHSVAPAFQSQAEYKAIQLGSDDERYPTFQRERALCCSRYNPLPLLKETSTVDNRSSMTGAVTTKHEKGRNTALYFQWFWLFSREANVCTHRADQAIIFRVRGGWWPICQSVHNPDL
jgi:hypothetical protein